MKIFNEVATVIDFDKNDLTRSFFTITCYVCWRCKFISYRRAITAFNAVNRKLEKLGEWFRANKVSVDVQKAEMFVCHLTRS